MADEIPEGWDATPESVLRFACCPNPHCRAEYPDFHSPVGTLETVCDACGWSSVEHNPHYIDPREAQS